MTAKRAASKTSRAKHAPAAPAPTTVEGVESSPTFAPAEKAESFRISPDVGAIEPVEPILSPDELIRFRKEAVAARENYSDFTWKDSASRAWTIRPAVVNNHSIVLIEVHRGDQGRSRQISTAVFTEDGAMDAVLSLDAELR